MAGHRTDALNFTFNPMEKEVIFSVIIGYLGWHVHITIQERRHGVSIVKTNNLRPELLEQARKNLNFGGDLKGLLLLPWGKARGEAGKIRLQNTGVHRTVNSNVGMESPANRPSG